MPTPTTADQATLVFATAADVMSDFSDLVLLIDKYDPTHRLKKRIEGPVRKALLVAHAKLLFARMHIQEAASLAFTQLKIPDEERNDWSKEK